MWLTDASSPTKADNKSIVRAQWLDQHPPTVIVWRYHNTQFKEDFIGSNADDKKQTLIFHFIIESIKRSKNLSIWKAFQKKKKIIMWWCQWVWLNAVITNKGYATKYIFFYFT